MNDAAAVAGAVVGVATAYPLIGILLSRIVAPAIRNSSSLSVVGNAPQLRAARI